MSDQASFASIPGMEGTTLDSATIRMHLRYKADPDVPPPPYVRTSRPSVHAGDAGRADDPRRGGARRRPQPSAAMGTEDPRTRSRPVHFAGGGGSETRSTRRSTHPQVPQTTSPAPPEYTIADNTSDAAASSAYTWSGCASFVHDQASSAFSSLIPDKQSIIDGVCLAGKTLSLGVLVGMTASLMSELAEGGDGTEWWRQVSKIGDNVMNVFGVECDSEVESKSGPNGGVTNVSNDDELHAWW